MQKPRRQRLRAQLAQRLHPDHLVAFWDVDLDILINIRCVNLDALARVSAEDLRNAGLPITLIRILQFAGLIGKHHSRTSGRGSVK